MARPGFDVSVKPQENRKATFKEHINRRVLVNWVRITGLPSPKKWRLDRLLRELSLNITKYPEGRPPAFSWPTGAGVSRDLPAYRACVSYDYWCYFMSEGRKRLNEYNREQNLRIEINKEVTQKISDERNLGLLLRKKIKEAYLAAKKKVPDMSVKKERLHIGNELVLKPSLAAIKLNADLSDWEGLPVREMLTEEEREQYDRGELKYGSLTLPGGVTLPQPMLEKENESDRGKENVSEEGAEAARSPWNRKRTHENATEGTEPCTSKQAKIG
ncbi:hypothetical protein Aduo_015221 [Ancylostoma duodenale]